MMFCQSVPLNRIFQYQSKDSLLFIQNDSNFWHQIYMHLVAKHFPNVIKKCHPSMKLFRYMNLLSIIKTNCTGIVSKNNVSFIYNHFNLLWLIIHKSFNILIQKYIWNEIIHILQLFIGLNSFSIYCITFTSDTFHIST